MKFTRRFTKPNLPIESQITWKLAESKIVKANGDVVFEMSNIEVPNHWSQTAINILAQKYFRKAGVPNQTIHRSEEDSDLPVWLMKSEAVKASDVVFGSETSAKQIFHRLAGAWTYWGWKEGIFKQREKTLGISHYIGSDDLLKDEEAAQIFYDETYYLLAHQFFAPNSPQWFNTGLFWAYGITGDANGQWICDENGPQLTTNSYEHPQPHACFIQPISDNLVEENGIFDLLKKEALLFKHGSGTGSNFSNLRGPDELLSGGGKSSGMISFLKIFDIAAGSIASGGTTRRAAKMVVVDLDHPQIEEFIDWKMKEERKARALVIGSQILAETDGGEIYSDGFEGEAINTVSAQNANNSIRITNIFLESVDGNNDWELNARKGNKVVKRIKARDLWNKIIRAAWACGDPGLQFHDTINEWHTCKSDGEIKASNPCSEYMFLDNTACNLASLNLGKFVDSNHNFNTNDFEYVIKLCTIILEISVFMASFPSREIAENSYLYRTLGLGYMNLGGILMRMGLGYDSDNGRNLSAAITAFMHGVSYRTSAEMASELGPFARWEANKDCMAKVIQMHKDAVKQINCDGQAGRIITEALKIWEPLGGGCAFRNAQVTLLAPTGTIHLVTDCDTSGIEPDFSLIKYKNLSGGGMIQIVNECVPQALKTLGYTAAQITIMTQHIKENGNLEDYKVNGQNLPEEHLKVFDCANPSGTGTRSLRPMAHVLMMAAVQPFLSGAISKTCNLPNDSTIQDVDFIYREAHRLGLKAIAIYRDGSKLTQPLSSKKEIKNENYSRLSMPDMSPAFGQTTGGDMSELFDSIAEENQPSLEELERTLGFRNNPAIRQPLPMRRNGYRQKVRIDGQSIYLSTGEYSDGRLGEIWIEISREGSTVRALLGGFSKLVSIALQFGVPLKQLVDAFVYTKFEPSGLVEGHNQIKLTTSVFDFVFRELGIHYLNQTEFANVNQEENDAGASAFIDLDKYKNTIPIMALDVKDNKKLNFTGNPCPNCGHNTLIQTGTCVQCTTCNQDSGCG